MAKPASVVFAEYQTLIKSSRTTTAIVNAFDLNWAENTNVYHYDVAIIPLWEARPGKPIVISRKKASEVIMRMQTHVAPQLFPKHGVFDGKKNMFSWIKYDIAEISVQVPLDSGERHNMKMVGVTVKYVKVVNVGILSRVARGDTSVSEPASEALNMLNMSVQAYPRSNQDVLSKGAAFYISHRKKADNKVAPFELWHGFNQTVRLTHKGLILNVNTTVGIVVPKRSLQDIAMTLLRLRNLRDLDRLQSHDPNFLRLKAVIRVLRVCPNYGRNRRGRKAGGLVPNASDITFDNKDGRTVTVSQHFQSAYGMTLRPNELGISFDKSDTVIPISCLDTEQQLFNNQASPEILREILDFIPRNPQERLSAIENGWDQLGLSASEFLNGAKISVTASPKTVTGRLLARPALQFGQQFVVAAGHQGTWDVMRKQLHSPISIGRAWCVVDFSGSRDQNVIIKFSDDLKIAMASLGINAQKPAIFYENPRRDLPKILYACGEQMKAMLMVVLLPDNAPEIYNAVKQWGDVTSGVATQCVRWSRKLSDSISSTKGANQYLNNLILKINAKLFGRSFVPIDSSIDFFQGQPTMIIGADVSHPGPQSNFPSVASVVASVDRLGSKYTARIEIQKSRVEIIQDLEAMMMECFSTFFELNKALPQRLIFYRDGVSEGEFETVLQAEVNTSLRSAVDRFYRSKGASESQRPKLTFIVVTKRHHIRFIPNNQQNTDKSRNCQAGFVVEDDLRRPLYDDFYLQSQAGLKGTSVPGHYTILRDDIFESFFKNKPLAKQAIEQFTYTLCHSYSRATRSVKIPAPVYYADLVCRRGKFHFDDLSDTRSVQSGGSDMDLAEYRRHFKPLHTAMKTRMFFM